MVCLVVCLDLLITDVPDVKTASCCCLQLACCGLWLVGFNGSATPNDVRLSPEKSPAPDFPISRGVLLHCHLQRLEKGATFDMFLPLSDFEAWVDCVSLAEVSLSFL